MRKLKGLTLVECLILIVVIVGLVGLGTFLSDFQKAARYDAEAATTNPSTASTGYWTLAIPLTGTTSGGALGMGTLTNKVRFKMPWPATLIGASAIYRTGGSTSGQTVDVTEAGTSVLSTPIVMNSTTVTEGTISDAAIADEAVIGITTVVTSTTAVSDPTVQLIFKRK